MNRHNPNDVSEGNGRSVLLPNFLDGISELHNPTSTTGCRNETSTRVANLKRLLSVRRQTLEANKLKILSSKDDLVKDPIPHSPKPDCVFGKVGNTYSSDGLHLKKRNLAVCSEVSTPIKRKKDSGAIFFQFHMSKDICLSPWLVYWIRLFQWRLFFIHAQSSFNDHRNRFRSQIERFARRILKKDEIRYELSLQKRVEMHFYAGCQRIMAYDKSLNDIFVYARASKKILNEFFLSFNEANNTVDLRYSGFQLSNLDDLVDLMEKFVKLSGSLRSMYDINELMLVSAKNELFVEDLQQLLKLKSNHREFSRIQVENKKVLLSKLAENLPQCGWEQSLYPC